MFWCSESKYTFSQSVQETSRIFSLEIVIHFIKHTSDAWAVAQGLAFIWVIPSLRHGGAISLLEQKTCAFRCSDMQDLPIIKKQKTEIYDIMSKKKSQYALVIIENNKPT